MPHESDWDEAGVRLMLGDCLERLGEIAAGSVDAIICDPPYPCIQRSYGTLTEAEWHALMRGVVAESRRILKPTGSAVFILQPNSERVGKIRPWVFDFQAWACRAWNLVEDVYWWNYAALPMGGACHRGLLRSSIKPCVWLGDPACFRDQESVLWDEHQLAENYRRVKRARINLFSSGHPRVGRVDKGAINAASVRRGGVTPFNLIPIQGGNSRSGGGVYGHTAATPEPLCDWWVRYISPAGGVVCDPFVGSGTTGLAALKRGRKFVGIERDPAYFAIAVKRIAELTRPFALQA
jgi:DNA modification methylase